MKAFLVVFLAVSAVFSEFINIKDYVAPYKWPYNAIWTDGYEDKYLGNLGDTLKILDSKVYWGGKQAVYFDSTFMKVNFVQLKDSTFMKFDPQIVEHQPYVEFVETYKSSFIQYDSEDWSKAIAVGTIEIGYVGGLPSKVFTLGVFDDYIIRVRQKNAIYNAFPDNPIQVLSTTWFVRGIGPVRHESNLGKFEIISGQNGGVPLNQISASISVLTKLPELRIIKAFPNPFKTKISFDFSEKIEQILIYDLRGTLVRSLQGTARSWDGRDNQGRIVSKGVYITNFKSRFNTKPVKIFKK